MKKQKEKGITLIALVITIIVLLILAGISIMMLTGENSLINQAKSAKSITRKAQLEEAVKLAYGSVSIDKYTNDNEIVLEKIAKQLREDGYEVEEQGEEPNKRYYIKQDGKYYEITKEDEEVKVSDSITKIEEETDKLKPLDENTADPSTSITTGYGTIDVIWLSGNSNIPTTTPNSPESHLNGIKGIYWDKIAETGKKEEIDVKDSNKNNWYKYVAETGTADNTASRWANARNPEDGSYFVWIPRYAYRITYYASQVAWKNGEEPTGYYDGYGMWNVEGQLKYKIESGIKTIDYNGKKYIVHPAFMGKGSEDLGGGFGTDEKGIEGFWVAKYEMSRENSSDGITWNQDVESDFGGDDNLTTKAGNTSTTKIRAVSKPGVISWRHINIGKMYTNSIKYDTAKESHLMKNSEWGAVAYLAQSQYGKNGYEITVNSSIDFCTAGGSGATALTNIEQSSTGNETGIFDLVGGAWERVSEFSNADIYGYFSITGWTSATELSTSSGSTKYATKEVNTQEETNVSHWFNDFSQFICKENPFFIRGGDYSNGSNAGIFYACGNGGYSDGYDSFRVVLAP